MEAAPYFLRALVALWSLPPPLCDARRLAFVPRWLAMGLPLRRELWEVDLPSLPLEPQAVNNRLGTAKQTALTALCAARGCLAWGVYRGNENNR
jgi:hypothetical protein